jgi:thiamine monophosphate synthase
MRTAHFNEVSVSNRKSLNRVVAVAAMALASVALAQAPANDTCAGAEFINVNAGVTPASSSVTGRLDLAAATVESTMQCTTSVKNSVWYSFVAPVTGQYRIDNCGPNSNFDSVIQLYSGSCGSLSAPLSAECNDTGSGSNCVSGASAFATTLTAGTTYYVQVAVYSTVTVLPTFTTQLTVYPPAPPPANETCAGAEVVTPNGANMVLSSQARVLNGTAAVESPFACLTTQTLANRSVWYSITPTVTADYRIESCNTFGNTVSDTVLAVYEGTCGALTGTAATCNNDSCSSRSGLTTRLNAGTTYYVQLAKNGSTAPTIGNDGLQLGVSQVINGPADVCSATSPQLNLNETITVSTTAAPDGGYSVAQNNAQLDGGTCFTGLGQTTSSVGVGRDVTYQFRASNAGRYTFRLGTLSGSVNGIMYLTDSCVPVSGIQNSLYGPPVCIAATNRNSSADEQLTCVPMTANQSVYVWVDETSLSTAGATATLDVSPCVLEEEPNNSPADAGFLSCVTTGGINVASDVDFFNLGAHPAGTRVYAMAEAAAANNTDIDLRVTTDTRTLEYDDADLTTAFGANAPIIAGAVLGNEPAYLRVNHFSGTVAEPYLLYSQVQRDAPTLETEPNETMANATTSATNHFTGSITDGGTDIDVFKFNANAGDVIFAALDSTPDKTDAGTGTYNFTMSLLDSTGAILLTADEGTTTNNFTTTTGNLAATSPAFPGDGLVYRARVTGTYGIRVGKTSGTLSNPYNLSVSVGCADTSPTITAVTPNAGTPSGGQVVTLTGTNFSQRTVVRFGNATAQVTNITPTELTVNTPPNSSGEVAVTVINGVGLSASLSPGYTYDDPPGLPPILTGINPVFGPVTGGTTVTLTGSVFRRDAGVFFDVNGTVVGATSVTVNNATRITAVTPPQAEGYATVSVVNYDNLSAQLDAGFRYEGPPAVTSITPNTGLTTGGLTITLAGNNLRPGTTVRVGANLATAVTPADGGLSLTAVTPTSATNGPVPVVVTTLDTQSTTVTGGFTYVYPAPLITTVTPARGFAIGGQTITLTGSNFLTAPTVTVGGVAATNVTRVSATSVTFTSPPGSGTVDVVLTNSDAQAVTVTGGFTYVNAPVLTAITPAHGPVQGGTRITLTGTDFLRGAVVQLGGVPAFAVDVTSPTTITAVTNAGAAGVVDVKVINPEANAGRNDTQSSTLTGGFTYDGAPTLASVSPITGSTAGGTTVTLTGAGFLTGASVVFGTSAATSVTVVSPTELTAVTPARAVGVVSVTVANPDNQSAELQRAFRFVAPPTATAVAPTTGDVTGNTLVRITGTGFSASTSVTFGGIAAREVTLVSGTELDAITPPHAPGSVDVVVDTDGATATITGGFTYTRGAPTLTAIVPATGGLEGGSLVTLTGTGFAQGATITIGGNPATSVVIVSDVLARAVAPAHAAGAVDVVLTNDDAQAATLAGGYTYVAPPASGTGLLVDGGSGAVGSDPTGEGGTPGGVSCGCTSFDGSMLSLGGMGLLLVLSRRRRRS